MYSHRSTFIHVLAQMSTDTNGFTGTDCVCSGVPMFHVCGWNIPTISFILGFNFILINDATPDQIVQLMDEEGATLFAGLIFFFFFGNWFALYYVTRVFVPIFVFLHI